MFKSEMLHGREYLAERTENLCYERYLQVEGRLEADGRLGNGDRGGGKNAPESSIAT
jgi:hypothetical protein